MKKKVKRKMLRKLINEISDIESNPYCSPFPDNKAMDYGYRCALLKIRRNLERKLERMNE